MTRADRCNRWRIAATSTDIARKPRHFDQAVRASSPLRGCPDRPRHVANWSPGFCELAVMARQIRPHGVQHRRGRGRPAGSVARCDRGRPRGSPALAGLGRVRRCRAGLWQDARPRSSTGCIRARRPSHDRRIMVRLVKGAYWDTEIKRAQIDGVPDFPVFTQEIRTRMSRISAARASFWRMTDRIYPQFATHNAHSGRGHSRSRPRNRRRRSSSRSCTVWATRSMHLQVVDDEQGCAAGSMRRWARTSDLLAYLVRRLAGERREFSSFVNKIVDADRSGRPKIVVPDPFAQLAAEMRATRHRSAYRQTGRDLRARAPDQLRRAGT